MNKGDRHAIAVSAIHSLGNPLETAAVRRGHPKRTKAAMVGGAIGAGVGSFLGPCGALVGAGCGAWLGSMWGDKQDRATGGSLRRDLI